jgi:DNA-binding beta-propeller fold protein YncE
MRQFRSCRIIRTRAISAILALVAIAVIFVSAAPALAAGPSNFCPSGSGAGQCKDPASVAVDQSTGDVYITEDNNWRVDQFGSSTAFLHAFGFGVGNGANELQTCTTTCITGREGTGSAAMRPESVAVDSSTHAVYVSDPGRDRVDELTIDPLTEEYEFVLTFGKEVNKTAVADAATRASEENVCPAAGHPNDVCGDGTRGPEPGAFNIDSYTYNKLPLVIEPLSHDVWVGDAERVQVFAEAGDHVSEVALPGSGVIASLALDTDPSSPAFGDIYVVDPPLNERQEFEPPSAGTYTLEFEGETTAALPFNASHAEVRAALEGLATIGTGNVEVQPEGFESRALSVYFREALAATNVPQLVASGGSVATLFNGASGGLHKYTSSGTLIENLDVGGYPQSVTVDPATGDVFVGDCTRTYGPGSACATPYSLLEYSPAGSQREAFAAGEVIGGPYGNAIAFGDGAQRLYLVSGTDSPSAAQVFTLPQPGPLPEAGGTQARSVGKTTVELCAAINPEGAPTTGHFEYIAATAYAENEEHGHEGFQGALSTAESSRIGGDFSYAHSVCQKLSGLEPDTSYRFKVVTHNEDGTVTGEAATTATLPPAAIDSTSVSAVTAGSATFEAKINPLGEATTYYFEYVAEAAALENEAHGQPAFADAERAPAEPEAIGAGEAEVSVSRHVQDLVAGTAYRYRVVAVNAVAESHGGSFAGPSRTFTTQLPALPGLPDHRGWELVSPPEKIGALFKPNGETGALQAAADGESITYLATAPTEEEPAGSMLRAQVLSTRGQGGWESRDISGPHRVISPLVFGEGWEYRLFSADLSDSVFQPFGVFEPVLSAQASESTSFLRTDFTSGDPSAFCTNSCYRPLVTGCPKSEPCAPSVEEAADVPAGTEFGCVTSGDSCNSGFAGGPQFQGATRDLANIVMKSTVELTGVPAVAGGLYEWSAGRAPAEALRLVSAMPGGEAAVGPELGFNNEDARNAISTDGSRVAWTSAGHLYLRVNATSPQSQVSGSEVNGSQCTEPEMACTIQIDALQGGPGGQTPEPRFQLASVDSSRIFFTDTQQLTTDASSPSAAGDLYEYDLTRPAGERLVDLTPAQGSEAAGVLGAVLGGGEDGSYLYFVANGALAAGASPGDCGSERADACNLYMRHDGATTLVTTLSGEDSPDWAKGGADLHNLTARVSPNGRWLAFMSSDSLTGYDNSDALSGRPDEEVFLYHAPAEAGTGSLVCASCDPTGARPDGVEYESAGTEAMPLAGGRVAWGNTWIAAGVPGWTQFALGEARYQSRYLSNAGRLFFNSSDALVPQDTNGQQDVYQYEPPGDAAEAPQGDTCTESSPTYSHGSGGCIDLISSGTSPEESGFLDASESGDDVFLLTSAKLSYRDFDSALDVYDARVGGGESEPAKPIECAGDACQATESAPPAPGTSSLAFSGPGNLAPTQSSSEAPSVKHSRKKIATEKLKEALKRCQAKFVHRRRTRARCERRARRHAAAGSRQAMAPHRARGKRKNGRQGR